MAAKLKKEAIDQIRQDFIDGKRFTIPALALALNCERSTIVNYRRMFAAIKNHHPDRLSDFSFLLKISNVKSGYFGLDRDNDLDTVFRQVVDQYSSNYGFKPAPLFAIYTSIVKKPYSYRIFTLRFWKWKREANICYYHHLRIRHVSHEDELILKRWRKLTNDARKFRIAMAILESYQGRHLTEIARLVDKPVAIVIRWFNDYRKDGLPVIGLKKFTLSDCAKEKIKRKQDQLIKLVHQPPAAFGINRTIWTLGDLAQVYQKETGEFIGRTTVAENLKIRQYGFKKSRESLTSNDPKFREKLDHIKLVLSQLKPDEKFFSIDEYGHFAVKLKGGRSIQHRDHIKIIPQVQQSKGFMVVIAALELSTNQVTHFYSKKKDTEEMIKLVDLLSQQYKGSQNIYLSWDAAAWHNSKILKEHLRHVNSAEYLLANRTPMVHLAPLPSSAQFLNVIESVFSGLARAVIHDSDYQSVEDCQHAIDRHFAERNAFFLAHPQKAGKMIWGKELVKAVFDETHNCDIKK